MRYRSTTKRKRAVLNARQTISDKHGLVEYAIDNDMIIYQRRISNNYNYTVVSQVPKR